MNRNRKRKSRQFESFEDRRLLAGDLVAHWVADDLNETVIEDQPITQWLDRVAQLPAAANGAPGLATNQLGGRSAVRFDATDGEDYFVIGRDDNPISNANDFTVVVAFATSATTTGGNGDWFENTALVDADGLGFTEGWGITINQAGQASAGLEDGFGSTVTSVYSTASGLNDGQLHVVSFTRSAGTMSLYVDDGAADSRDDGSTKARGRERFMIGRLLSGGNAYTGDIAQVQIYNGQLDAAEVSAKTSEIVDYYNNASPVPNDDTYTTNEDNILFLVPQPGVLANDTDADGDALKPVLVDDVSHGTLSLLDTGSFLYSPEANFAGTDTFTYRAFDFRESDTLATVTIEVTPVDDPTRGVADTYKLRPTQVLSTDATTGVLANDVNVDGDTLRAVLESDVTNGQLQLNEDGSFEYDPQGFAGTATFMYRVDDGTQQTDPIAVSLIANTPPRAVLDTFTVDEDITLSPDAAAGLLGNDTDADGNTLMAIIDELPLNGQLTLNDDGSFAYQPNENYHGVDLFSYRVSDGVDESDSTLAQITIRSVNDPPTTVEDGFFVLPDRSLDVMAEFGVLRNDTDIESDVASVAQLVDAPTNGTINFNDDGSFQYTPNAGFIGEDSFTYRAGDGQDFSEPQPVTLTVTTQPIVISEVMASNATTLTTVLRNVETDEFVGEVLSPDWFEVQNLLDQDVDIGGLHATDDADNLTKWRFPAGTIVPANGYLVVFASGLDIDDASLDQQGSLHTNFQISTDNDYLAITTLDGAVVHDLGESLPTLRTHITYGLNDDRSAAGYFTTPTPGTANGPTALSGLVEDTQFDVDRGFFTEAFQLTISSETADAIIRYTTDGTVPDESSTLYEGPLTVDKTSTIRARAFKDQMVATNTDTQTYFFLDDVVQQDAQQTVDAGFAEMWNRTSPDYGLDSEDQLPRIAGDENLSVAQAREVLKDSLLSLPTLSISMNTDDLFATDGGIYTNAGRSGKDWERPTSVELIHPDGQEGFQIDSGIRIQGGAFRGFGLTKKKSFRLLFKTQYGPGKLNYPLYGGDAVDEFDTLTLRMEANDGWQWDGAGAQPVYARDQFHRDTQRAMGHPASHGRNVHLYINGFYWGMYNVVERPDDSFGAAYFGSDKYDWDGQNSGSAINAEEDRFRASRGRDVWRSLTSLTGDIRDAETEEQRTALYMQALGRNPDGTRNPELPVLIDAVNYTDYLIANYYGGNADWPRKNYYFGRENSPDSEGFKFFLWDAEWSLFLRSQRGANLINDPAGVALPWRGLRASEEFRVMVGDRVQKHFFNGGALYVDPENPNWDPENPERNQPAKRWVEFTESIYGGLIAESARWGDQHRGTPYTRDIHWTRENERIINDWFPVRTFELLDIFRDLDLYPSVDAATFSQRGGVVATDQDISLNGPGGTIYYTTDGSDPRLLGGAVSGDAITYDGPFRLADSTTVRVRVLNEGVWSAIDEAEFLVGAVPASSDSLRISEVNYNPGARQPNEVAAGVNDKDEFEFIEFVNISDQTIDLTQVQLVQQVDGADRIGVAFDFADADRKLLDPGERVLIVENRGAFGVRYGDELSGLIAGQWSGGLSNDTETITVMSGDQTLQQMTYNDEWYAATDGGGATLEIIDATQADLAQWSTSGAWRASLPGGSPGSAGDGRVLGDSNGDGVFDSGDLGAVFQAGEYEDDIAGNSTFAEGDWDGDGDFTTADLVLAFQRGGYVAAARQRSLPLTQDAQTVDEEVRRRAAIDSLMARSTSDKSYDELADFEQNVI